MFIHLIKKKRKFYFLHLRGGNLQPVHDAAPWIQWVNKRDRLGRSAQAEGSRTCTCTHARVFALVRREKRSRSLVRIFTSRYTRDRLVYELEVREVVQRVRPSSRRPWNPSYRFPPDSGPRFEDRTGRSLPSGRP